jgi:hypothetical protein
MGTAVLCAGQAKRSSQRSSPIHRHSVAQDAATQVSPLKESMSANPALHSGVSGPLRKRFGGFWEHANDPRSSYMSAATADTAVLTESAGTGGTPEPSGSAHSSPHIRCCCWLLPESLHAQSLVSHSFQI